MPVLGMFKANSEKNHFLILACNVFKMTPSQIFQSYNVFIVIEIILQALSGDFQHACGKMRA